MFKHLVKLVFCFGFFAAAANAQFVQQIKIEGNNRVEADAIESVVKTEVGNEIAPQQIRKDIEAIHALGFFADVSVHLENETLIYRVKEKTFLFKVLFEGNDKESEDDLKEQIQIKGNSFLDPSELQRSLEQLRAYYDGKGYFLTDLSYDLRQVDDKGHNLVFLIEERQKVKIRNVEVLGNQALDDSQILPSLLSRENGLLSFLNGRGVFREEFLVQDRQIIRDLYGRKGFLDVEVSQADVALSLDKKNASIFFRISEGLKYDFGEIDVAGTLLHPKEELFEKIQSKKGEVANTALIQQDIANLSKVYADEGYAYVNVIPQDQRNQDSKTIDIRYVIQPGEKVRVNQIRFVGNDSTRDKVLRREMQIVEGDLYSLSKIQSSRANIERLALYDEVKLTTPRANSDNLVDIVVEVTEKQTGSFNLGAGFNTLDSFQIIGTIQKRNLFGYGVDLSLDARIGGRVQSFNLRYRDEYFLDSKWGMTLSAFSIERRFSNFDLTSRGSTLGFDYPIYQKGLERIRLGLSYSLIDQNISNIQPTVEKIFTGGVTSSITTVISRDTRNRVFEPSKGSFLRLSEELAGGPFGGENSFSKLEFDARWFYPLFEKSKLGFLRDSVFGLHFETGYVTPLSSDDRVPLFERYFPGGILSLRGFPLRSLGPEIQVASSNDPGNLVTSDFVIGGNKQLIFNAEWVFPIVKAANINGVLFFDMGNAFDNGESMFTLAGQRQSVGYGLRWFSPIGPLRFEWGYPLDRKEDESRSVFDFTIGSLF